MIMKTKNYILKLIQTKEEIRASEVIKALKITRQTAAQHFRELIAQKKLIKIGSTRNAKYAAYDKKKFFSNEIPAFTHRYLIKGLEEDRVFQQAALKMVFSKVLSSNAYGILNYAFTEMLNNAIDHSGSKKVLVQFEYVGSQIIFAVIDKGIGVFENVMRKFKLKNHYEAVEHLLKGKQTTDPKRHSGQGIFFTSKISDRFILESGRVRLTIDNDKTKDVFLKNVKLRKGTRVDFILSKSSKKDLKRLFDSYSGDDYEFNKTEITVHLSEKESEHMSRSQAKRILFGLDAFKIIILNFRKVKEVGQAFADEIFRVYKNAHPDIELKPVHMSPAVEFMVMRTFQKPYNKK